MGRVLRSVAMLLPLLAAGLERLRARPADSRRVWIPGAFLLLGAAAPSPAGIPLPPPGEVWSGVEVPGFSIRGNARPEQLRTVARDLETLRIVLAHIAGDDRSEVRPIPVVVFSDARSFDPYRRGFGAGAKNVAGYFTEHAGRRMIALLVTSRVNAYAAVYHEYLHHVVRSTLGKVPLWFNEGIAGVYETFDCDGKRAVVGRASFEKLDWLHTKPWLPLRELFRMDGEEARVHGENDDLTTTFYAESWLLVHDLFFGHPERRPQLATFLEAYARGEPHDQAFERSFQGGIDAVEAELEAYLKGAIPFVTMSFDALKVPEPGAVTTPPRAEILDTLGELLLTGSDTEAAGAGTLFRASLEAAPGDLRARAGLGEAAFFDHRSEEAAPLLDAAVDAGFDDPVALRIAAHLALDRSEAPGTSAGPDPAPGVLRARALAKRALAGDPGDADTLALYGMTFVGDSGDVSEGIEALVAADRQQPDRRDVLHNLLALYVAKRDRPGAEAVAARIGAGGNAEDAAWADEAVARLDLHESDEAVAAKDYERALALLRSARDKIRDDALKAKIDDHIAALERAVGERKKGTRPPAPRSGAPKR